MSGEDGLAEQLSRLVAVSALILRRSWLRAALVTVTLLPLAWVLVYRGRPLLGDDILWHAPAVQLAQLIGLAALDALAIALALAGPLAAFALAGASETVRLDAVFKRAFARTPALAFVAFLGTCAPAVRMEIHDAYIWWARPELPYALEIGFMATGVVVPGYALGALLWVAEIACEGGAPLRAFGRAWNLGRGHRILTGVAFAGSLVPAVAGSASGFTGGPVLRPLKEVLPFVGGALSVVAYALLAVAAHAVASGEGDEEGV